MAIRRTSLPVLATSRPSATRSTSPTVALTFPRPTITSSGVTREHCHTAGVSPGGQKHSRLHCRRGLWEQLLPFGTTAITLKEIFTQWELRWEPKARQTPLQQSSSTPAFLLLSCPYSNDHTWAKDRYVELLETAAAKSRFSPTYLQQRWNYLGPHELGIVAEDDSMRGLRHRLASHCRPSCHSHDSFATPHQNVGG